MLYSYKFTDKCQRGSNIISTYMEAQEYVKECIIDSNKKTIRLNTTLTPAEAKELIVSLDSDFNLLNTYNEVRLYVRLDDASKLKLLEADDYIARATYTDERLTLLTSYSVKELLSLMTELKIAYSLQRRTFSAKIDCANCAKKVENALNSNEAVENAIFDFNRGKLIVTSALSKEEIKRLCREVEDEIEFLDSPKEYKLSVEIDCAECARKVEEALNSNPKVERASFDFPKGRLTVIGDITEEEIKELAKAVEDDIEFLDSSKEYRFDVEIDCAECARKVEEALNSNPKVERASFDFPKGKLSVKANLTEKEIKELCKSVEDDIVFKEEKKKKNTKLDITLIRIITAAVIFAISELLKLPYLAIVSYIIAGYDVVFKALKNILKGKVFDENFLMAIATLGALFIASYEEAAGVMIFYQVGEYFQDKAVGKARRSIGALMDLTEDITHLVVDGRIEDVKTESVTVGSIITVKAGEKLPLDGVVIDGTSFLDTKALTGEPVPVKVERNSKVLSGSINGEGTLKIKTTASYSDSTASKIMKLIEESEGKKAKSEKFITKFSKHYTPFVCLAALLTAIIPPLFTSVSWYDSIYRGCMLLVISCPCALVLSVPLTYFSSMGNFARNGILVRGDDAIQKLAHMQLLAMDKTGTLTEGVFSVQGYDHLRCSEEHILSLAAALESYSTHPIAKAIIEKEGSKNTSSAENVKEIAGIGLEGVVNGKNIKVGSSRIIKDAPTSKKEGTLVYVSENDELVGIIVIADRIKDSSPKAIESLRAEGVKELWMLSGDRKERANSTAKALGLDGAIGELLPSDKVNAIEALLKKGYVTGYAGDGVNDAPTLKRADVGISMGDKGSDAAIEASDVVIMNDDISLIANGVKIAKKTEAIVKQNIAFSLIVKAIIFILAIIGLTNMWVAVFADTGVALIAVINSMRAFKLKERA